MTTTHRTRSTWRKSSHSGNGGNCVEVSTHDHQIHIRHSKDPTGPVIILTPRAWATFRASLTNTAKQT